MAYKITFSFGQNWKKYQATINKETIQNAREHLVNWLGEDYIRDKTVIDIGSGSGLSSLAFFLEGAKRIVSFDYDKYSVEATKKFWYDNKKPVNWNIFHASILTEDLVKDTGTFDIVYSWGVLHHTGKMWDALDKTIQFMGVGAVLWISIYQNVETYNEDLALKIKYNKASFLKKQLMILNEIRKMKVDLRRSGINIKQWRNNRKRGMNVYYDLIDWLGGLPYEVATKTEVVLFCNIRNLNLIKSNDKEACIEYLFIKN